MDTFIFDLDNTLYPASNSLFPLIDARINQYMHERAGIPEEQVDALRRLYWREYGLTMVGLAKHHGVDPEDYLEYVHDVDVAAVLRPCPELALALAALPGVKVVLTNGSLAHAQRVLKVLGLREVFTEIFDVRLAAYRPKPYPEPYRETLRRLGVPGSRCVMVEDMAVNLKTAKEFGMATVLIDPGNGPGNGEAYVDVRIDDVTLFPDAYARFARGKKKAG
ncbi:pyrimidine 5'-nucleotidase [Desulfonatronum lacustre]|uniref:pyrimidine 5'-nucleotidase n=1 Tax=Desulfonatronum lacustre TaxID=66849 RepID=UPI00048E804F|nr:pyrimidine 5'-nucleotidase [Desulfonatronum lacustre]SMP73233.1 putative hydrolase of the HAD superfamily [Desulfonatronum zhilinae]